MSRAESWIRRLGLEPHPEGGHYREIYRSPEVVPRAGLPARFPGERAFATSIYFLLSAGQVSRFHRLKADEVWHLYEGGPAVLHVLDPGTGYRGLRLGLDAGRGEAPQLVIPAGCWFAVELEPGADLLLAGCTMAPGFEFADFELGRGEDLRTAFPAQADLIGRLAADGEPRRGA
jgi:hypothetical protein